MAIGSAAPAADGVRHEIDTLLLGIGAVPEHTLATQAGLDCDNGIVVDAHMRSSDPAILAIGDCCSFPEPTSGRRLRLESVQNANDQAKTAVATLTGQLAAHTALPWFWSEQDSELQMAGLNRPRRAMSAAGNRAACRSGTCRRPLLAVDAMNDPAAYMTAKKLLERGASVAKAAVRDPAAQFKDWLA